MNDYLKNTFAQDIETLWAETTKRQAEIVKRKKNIEKAIENDVAEAKKKYNKLREDQYSRLSENAKADMKIRERHIAKSSFVGFKAFLLAILLEVIFVIFKLVVYDLTIVSNFLTYIIFFSFFNIFMLIVLKFKAKLSTKIVTEINQKPEIKEYLTNVSKIKAEEDNWIGFLKELKYATDIQQIENDERKNNYEGVRMKVIAHRYPTTIFIYCKKFSSNTHCKVFIDGIEQSYIDDKSIVTLKLNPGYHSVKIYHVYDRTYSDGSSRYSELKYVFQMSAEECPKFILCTRVDSYSSVSKCNVVSCAEFEEASGSKIIK